MLPVLASSQTNYWTTPISVTDSLSDYGNVRIHRMDGPQGFQFYMLYDKKINDSTSAIAMRDFYNHEEEFIVYQEEGKICTKPEMMVYIYSQDQYYLFFEYKDADQSQRDIAYIMFEDGAFSDLRFLANSQCDEHHIETSVEHFERIVWMCDDTVKTQYYKYYYQNDSVAIRGPEVVDYGNCSQPFILESGSELSYLKNSAEGMNLMLVTADYNGVLNPVETIYSYDSLGSMSCSASMMGSMGIMSFDKIDTVHTICIYDRFWSNNIDSLSFHQKEPFNASLYTFDLIVSDYYDMGNIAIELNNDTVQDIFVSEYYIPQSIDEYYNISQSDVPVRNPELYTGKDFPSYFHTILVYERFINDHWQLMGSTLNVSWGGVDDQQDNTSSMQVTPNPIQDEFTVKIHNPEGSKITFTLAGITGRSSAQVTRSTEKGVDATFTFHLSEFFHHNASGPYLLQCNDGSQLKTAKVLIH